MDTMDIQTAMVVGTARSDAWSQAQAFPIPGGTIIVLVSLRYTGESDLIDIASIGSDLLETIGRTPDYSLENLNLSDDEIVSSILIARTTNSTLEISGIGSVELYLYRNSQLGRLFVGSPEVVSLTGSLHAEDTFLALTSDTIHAVGLPVLRQLMATGIAAADDLAVHIHRQANSSNLAAAFVAVSLGHPDVTVIPDTAPLLRWNGIAGAVHRIVEKWSLPKPLVIEPEKRRTNLWIGSVLLALLAVGILVGAVRRSAIVKEQAYTNLSQGVLQKIDEARSVGDLNPERAKILLQQSRAEIDAFGTRKESRSFAPQVEELVITLTKAETEIFKKSQITLTTLAETSVIKKDLTPVALAVDENGTLYLSDTSLPRIVGISSTDKSVFEYATDSVGKTGEMGIYKKKVYTLVSDGIAQITSTESKVVITPDDLWKDVQMLDVFAGNVYLLDKGQSEIWKYPALTDGFGTRKRWLAPGIEPDLSNVVDMKVDGDVWIVTTSGKLVRYSRGVPVPFTMEGLPASGTTLKDPKAVYATGTQVFVLERGEKRVVVFEEETGKYLKQYSSDDFERAKDMTVFDGKAYLLFDDKIAWFGL